MVSSRITQKHQATIPAEIRKVLDLHGGDFVRFEIHDNEVIIRKITSLDLEFTRALQKTVSEEWSSEEDNRLYANL
jgi:antitoxin PrlF